MDEKIKTIKKSLSDELASNLKQCDDSVFGELNSYGYCSSELVDMITNYEKQSGLDLINCNEVVKKSLIKSKNDR